MCCKRLLFPIALFTASLLLHACGGSDSNDSAPATTTSKSIVAVPSLGMLQGATINLYQSDAATLLGSASLEADGTVAIEYAGDYSGPVVVELVGDAGTTYFDESAGTQLATGSGPLLHALVPTGTSRTAVTPLTEIAYRIAMAQSLALDDAVINDVNERVRLALAAQLSDLLSAPQLFSGTTTNGSLANDEAGSYALLLSALAQLGAGGGTPALTITTQLADDLADGSLDGMTGGTAIAGLLYTPASFAADLQTQLTAMATGYGAAALQTAVTAYGAVQTTIDTTNLGSGSGSGTSACGDTSSAETFFASNAGDITVYAAGGNGGMTTFYDDATSYQLTIVAAGSLGGPGYRIVDDNGNPLGAVYDAASHTYDDQAHEVNFIHNDGTFPQGVLQCDKSTGDWTVVLSDLSMPPSSVTLNSVQPASGGGGGQMGGAIQNGDLALTGDTTTLAGSVGVTGTADGTGSAANFWHPSAITSDGASLFVMSKEYPVDVMHPNTYYIRKIDIASGTVTTLPGSFTPLAGFLTSDGSYLYRAVGSGVYRIDPTSGAVTTLATIGNASFNGITTDGTSLYLSASNLSNKLVYKVDIASGADSVFADDAGFGNLQGITTDGSSLFVADMANDQIHRIDIATAATSVFASDIKLLNVEALGCDGANLYFSKPSISPAIGRVEIATGTVEWLIGYMTGLGSADGDVNTASFSAPTSFTTDGSSLFLTDGGDNHTLRRID